MIYHWLADSVKSSTEIYAAYMAFLNGISGLIITRDSEVIMFSPCVFVCVWLSMFVMMFVQTI